MTVSELIDQLKTLPPHLPVMTPGEIGYDHVKQRAHYRCRLCAAWLVG